MIEKCNCWRSYCEFFDPSEWNWWQSYSREGLERKLEYMKKEILEIETVLNNKQK